MILFLAGAPAGVRVFGGPLDEWVRRNPVTTAFQLWDIAFAEDKFVAVGPLGKILVSTNGTEWTEAVSGVPLFLFSVGYGGGKFIAVGDLGVVLISDDGIHWAGQNSGVSHALTAVTYGNGVFVAAGSSPAPGTIVTSPDGITWTKRQAGGLPGVVSTAGFGEGNFVIGGSDPLIWTSSDGTNWTARTNATPPRLSDLAYGNGTFVGVANGSRQVFTSPDGVAWTPHPGPGSAAITFGNGVFVAGGGISTNGMAWETFGGGFIRSIAYGHNTYVAATETALVRLSDGRNWQLAWPPIEFRGGLKSVAHNATNFVAVGTQGTILASSNAINWTVLFAEFANSRARPYNDVIYGHGKFVTVGGFVNNFDRLTSTSVDGYTWQKSGGPGVPLSSVVAFGGMFVAVGTYEPFLFEPTDSTIVTSLDGLTWTQQRSRRPESLSSIAVVNGMLVASGSTTLTSRDGTNWVEQPSLRGGDLTYGNGVYVAVRAAQNLIEIISSHDGVTWAVRHQSTSPVWEIIYELGLFVVLRLGGPLLTSPDGINWTPHAIVEGTDIVYGNGTFVTVRGGGTIYQSGSMLPRFLLPVLRFPDGSSRIGLEIHGGGTVFTEIEASNNLFTWTPAFSGTNAAGTTMTVTNRSTSPIQFYRAKVQYPR